MANIQCVGIAQVGNDILNFPFFVDSFDLITGKGINVLLFWSIDTVEHLDLMLNGKF